MHITVPCVVYIPQFTGLYITLRRNRKGIKARQAYGKAQNRISMHINRIKADSPLLLTRQPSSILYQTRVRSLLDLSPEEQQYDIYETPSVLTAIELNPETYRNAGWGFLVTCETGNRYDRHDTRVLICGIGYPYNPCLQWECKDSYGHDNEWYFTVQSLNDTPIGQIKFVE